MAADETEEEPYRAYTRSLLRKTKYRAAWFPGETMELGAVGFLVDGVFDQQARLKDWGISFRRKPTPKRTWSYDYESSTGVSRKYKVRGMSSEVVSSIGKASAGVRFDFSRAGAVIFSAQHCSPLEIDNKRALQAAIRGVADEWDINYVVITKVMKSKSATILVSGKPGAWIELRAEGEVAPGGVDVADLAFGFQRARTSEMEVKFVGEGSLTPLYECHRMKQPQRFIRDPKKWQLVKWMPN